MIKTSVRGVVPVGFGRAPGEQISAIRWCSSSLRHECQDWVGVDDMGIEQIEIVLVPKSISVSDKTSPFWTLPIWS
jgi:hypothetical protein